MWRVSELEKRTDQLMDRVAEAERRGDHEEHAAALEDYLRLAYSYEDTGEAFDIGPWSETLADSYLALGRVDDAVRVIREATRRGHTDGAESMCDLAEKLMRGGHEPHARPLWDAAKAGFPDDVWIYVQAGIEYGDIGDQTTALGWLTPGMELALRTGDPESALEQLVPLRESSLSALGHDTDDLQNRASQALAAQESSTTRP